MRAITQSGEFQFDFLVQNMYFWFAVVGSSQQTVTICAAAQSVREQ